MLKTLLNDLKNGTSHCVDFLKEDSIEKTISTTGIKVRKIFAPILRLAYRTQTEYKIVIDHREKLKRSRKGKFFAINHRQGDDIVIGANVVNRSAYFVFGNQYLSLDTSNGLGLWAYGMILLNRDVKTNRQAIYQKMKYVIEHGGNIIIYPEGYWNLDDNGEADERHGADAHNSENWPIQDFNIGAFRLAQEKDELLELMVTEYWRLMEKYSVYKRSELEEKESLKAQWERLKKELLATCDIESTGYKLDLADEKRIGKAKVVHGVVTRKEAFAYLEGRKIK